MKDLPLNNLQWLICHKNPTKLNNFKKYFNLILITFKHSYSY